MILTSLDRYKRHIGATTDDDDLKHVEALEDATAIALNQTDRDFGAEVVTEDRTFKYDGGGSLEIDDAQAVNSVAYLPSGSLLTAGSWIARSEGPSSITAYSYLELPPFSPISGEMGFTFNLDVVLAQYGRNFREIDVRVNADWGWPDVPDDIQRAIIWTAAHLENTTSYRQGALAAKSVAEVAESYVIEQEARQQAPQEAIPPRALAIFEDYRRHTL